MRFSFSDLPNFRRFDEYSGLWAIEPNAGHTLAELFSGTDWNQHESKAGVPPAERFEKQGKAVAVVPIIGTMQKQRASTGGTSTIDVRRRLRQAAADASISSILLAIDSPGGTVAGTQALADDIRAARHKKPVYAHVEDEGLSAAYWAASQADKIYAGTGTTSVGSVGAYLVVRASKSNGDGKSSADVQVIRSGPLKAAGMGELTPERLAELQNFVNGTQRYFTEAVRKGRRLSKDAVEQVAQGGVYLAEAAQSLGLIDGIQSYERTLAELVRL